MLNFISEVITKVSSLLNMLQAKQFLSIVLVGFLLLTTNVKQDVGNPISKMFDKIVHQDDSQRPQTTKEWKQEASATKGDPEERLKRIGEQSAEAVKDLGSLYSDTAERSASSLRNGTKTGK